MSPTARKTVSTLFLTLLISIACAAPARAEGFISPFIGYNFGGDSGCPSISNCEDKNLNWGIGVGAVGGLFGVEAEFAQRVDQLDDVVDLARIDDAEAVDVPVDGIADLVDPPVVVFAEPHYAPFKLGRAFRHKGVADFAGRNGPG